MVADLDHHLDDESVGILSQKISIHETSRNIQSGVGLFISLKNITHVVLQVAIITHDGARDIKCLQGVVPVEV